MNVVGTRFALAACSETGGAAMLAVVERVTSFTAARMRPLTLACSLGLFTSPSKGIARSLLPS